MAKRKLTDDQLEALAEFFGELANGFALWQDILTRLRAGDNVSPQELLDAQTGLTNVQDSCALLATSLSKVA